MAIALFKIVVDQSAIARSAGRIDLKRVTNKVAGRLRGRASVGPVPVVVLLVATAGIGRSARGRDVVIGHKRAIRTDKVRNALARLPQFLEVLSLSF